METPEVEVYDEVELGSGHETLDDAAEKLWRKAVKYGTWDPAEIDLSADRADCEALPSPLRVYLKRFCAAFYNAEENVARVFGPWITAAPTTVQQAFLSTQLVEEFKHTDFFRRYFSEVFETERSEALANPVHDTLRARGQRLLESLDADAETRTMRYVEATVHYQGVIEGVQANTGYHIFLDVFARKGLLPGLTRGFANIQRDEGRHVGFGLQILRHHARRDARCARRIKEMYAEFLPLIQQRYGQTMVEDGKVYGPPPEERGVERLTALYERRLRDIFGAAA